MWLYYYNNKLTSHELLFNKFGKKLLRIKTIFQQNKLILVFLGMWLQSNTVQISSVRPINLGPALTFTLAFRFVLKSFLNPVFDVAPNIDRVISNAMRI
jgi:hypothetical protein